MNSILSSLVGTVVDHSLSFAFGKRISAITKRRSGVRQIGFLEELEQRTLLSSVHGVVFQDANRDGVKDENESALPNRVITLSEAEFTRLLDADFSGSTGGPSLDGFVADGLWHTTTACIGEGSPNPDAEFAYFGFDATCNFEPGQHAGALTSASMSLSVDSEVWLTFSYRLEGEHGPAHDVASVQISVDEGDFFTLVTDADGSLLESSDWTSQSVDLSAYASHTVALRFHFDSYDEWVNGGLGWQLAS